MHFIHLRKYERPDVFAEAQVLPKGGATIAWLRLPDSKYSLYTIAKCCDKDVFCRYIGRSIAEGRMKAGQSHEVELPDGASREQIREILLEQYYKQEEAYDALVRSKVF